VMRELRKAVVTAKQNVDIERELKPLAEYKSIRQLLNFGQKTMMKD